MRLHFRIERANNVDSRAHVYDRQNRVRNFDQQIPQRLNLPTPVTQNNLDHNYTKCLLIIKQNYH